MASNAQNLYAQLLEVDKEEELIKKRRETLSNLVYSIYVNKDEIVCASYVGCYETKSLNDEQRKSLNDAIKTCNDALIKSFNFNYLEPHLWKGVKCDYLLNKAEKKLKKLAKSYGLEMIPEDKINKYLENQEEEDTNTL